MKAILALLAVVGTFAVVHHAPCLTDSATTLASTRTSLADGDGSCCAERAACEAPATRLTACESDAIGLGASESVAPVLAGRWVEARTASVFAGACHYNSEYTTQGRRAVVAGVFDAGQVEGLELGGQVFVAVVAADENLAEGGARRSILYLSDELSPVQRQALERAVLGAHAGALGEVTQVVAADVGVSLDGERYSARVAGLVRLAGAAMADRACCKMPLNVWYDALVELDDPIVGLSSEFVVADIGLGPAFERFDENNAFVGSFRVGSSERFVEPAGGFAIVD